MRILWIHQHAYGPDQTGGNRHAMLAAALGSLGHEVTICASSFNHKTRQETKEYGAVPWLRERVQGVDFLWLKTRTYHSQLARAAAMLSFQRVLLRAHRKGALPPFDVVVGSTPPPIASLAALRLARRAGVPFVLEVRDLWADTMRSMREDAVARWVAAGIGRTERKLMRRAELVITNLPLAERHLMQAGAREVLWIPNGLRAEDLAEVDQVQAADVEAETLQIVYAGALARYAGLDRLVKAVAVLAGRTDVPPFHLTIIGSGPERATIERLAARLAPGTVEVRAAVPRREVWQILKAADVVAVIMAPLDVFRHGVSPNKLFDAMAVARPILFAVDTPYDPLSADGAGIHIRSRDPEDLAGGLLDLLSLEKRQRDAMGQAARSVLIRDYDLDAHAARLAARLQELRAAP